MRITNTEFETVLPWPADAYVQGGTSGVVFGKDGSSYRTAFVEVFVDDSFLRGEGETVPEAEEHAWSKFVRYTTCGDSERGHEYAPFQYTNGGGLCTHCGHFATDLFTAEQLGQFCVTCGVATMWSRAGNDWYCEDHALSREERWLKNAEAGYRPSVIESLLEALDPDGS